MTENSNDDNGAGQIAVTDDLFGLPGDGLHWAWQRCGRYEYQKVLMHATNPDHLVPRSASPTDVAPLELAPRYRKGNAFWSRRSPGLPDVGTPRAAPDAWPLGSG